MRFIQFLVEAKKGPAAAMPAVNMPHNFAKNRYGAPQQGGAPRQPQGQPAVKPPTKAQRNTAKKDAIKTLAPVDPAMKQFLDIANGDRQKAMEMITLLGAMYQTKRTNPQAQLNVPKLVTQSQNGKALQSLFDLAKDKDLGQLAAMSQEIKRSAANPGANAPPAGTNNVPTTPGATAGQKTMLQKMINWIRQSKGQLSPADAQVVRKELDKAAKNAKPNPPLNAQQPVGKPVVTQG